MKEYGTLLRSHIIPYLEEQTKLKVLLEPNPSILAEPHLRLLYTGLEFRPVQFRETDFGHTGYDLDSLFDLIIHFLLTLHAEGDGPDNFLDEVINASFKLAFLFRQGISIEVVPQKFFATLVAQKRPGGQFFKNEEPGKKAFVYEETWEGLIMLPFVKRLEKLNKEGL
ncbi:MAG: hypothetical protein QXX12_00555 [Nanopusillaceae archaeon]